MEGQISGKMMERSEVFSTNECDVGCCKSTHHTIKSTEDKPPRERSHRLAPADVEALRQHLLQLKDAGIIIKSQSPCTSTIVVEEEQKDKDVCALQDTKQTVYSAKNRRCIGLSQRKPRV